MVKDSTKKKAPARGKDVIAQEKLDVANRNVKRLEDRIGAAEQAVKDLRVELQAAVKVRDYAALNPDLPADDEVAVAVTEAEVQADA